MNRQPPLEDNSRETPQAIRTSRWYDYLGSTVRWLWLEELIAGECE